MLENEDKDTDPDLFRIPEETVEWVRLSDLHDWMISRIGVGESDAIIAILRRDLKIGN